MAARVALGQAGVVAEPPGIAGKALRHIFRAEVQVSAGAHRARNALGAGLVDCVAVPACLAGEARQHTGVHDDSTLAKSAVIWAVVHACDCTR